MSRKNKWKGTILNKNNIDDYMNDLYEDTKGQYITQGVSFNKNDPFQMNLLKNALISHGSFSGFVKHLMHSYFEKSNEATEATWSPPVKESDTPQEQKNQSEPIVKDNNEEGQAHHELAPAPPPAQPKVTVTEQTTNKTKEPRKPLMRTGAGSLSEAILRPKGQ